MSRHQAIRLALLAATLGVACGLAGCGKQGVLKQPPPLFGSRAKAAYEAQKAQEARDDAQRSAEEARSGQASDQSAGDNAPRTKRDVLDPAQKLTPASKDPVAGANNLGGPPVQTEPTN